MLSNMGLIYKIACDITNKCYIGQTIQTLNNRICQHLYSVKKKSKCFLHRAIKKYGWQHFPFQIFIK